MQRATVSPRSLPVHLAELRVFHIPFSPLAVTVEHQGVLFKVSRPHYSDVNAWRGKYMILDNESKDYYAESFQEVGEWIRRVVQAASGSVQRFA